MALAIVVGWEHSLCEDDLSAETRELRRFTEFSIPHQEIDGQHVYFSNSGGNRYPVGRISSVGYPKITLTPPCIREEPFEHGSFVGKCFVTDEVALSRKRTHLKLSVTLFPKVSDVHETYVRTRPAKLLPWSPSFPYCELFRAAGGSSVLHISRREATNEPASNAAYGLSQIQLL